MEHEEDKVNVEEPTINLSCIKKEFEKEEFEFDENRYKLALTFENIFGKSSSEQRDNRDSLIAFLDDEVIMETVTIKLEDVKDEEDLIRDIMEQSDCNKCGGNYQGYCPDCSSLSHILNNLTPNIKPEADINTVPINTLEIKEVSMRQAVFALKTLPKGIIMGPFEGVAPIESTTGFQWKIKDKKLSNDQNGNWMKYIDSVENHVSKNLDVFQFDGILYFETNRDIQEGEELLVCYREETDEVLKSENEEEFYLVPVKKEKYPKVFACTLCCLGFRLERCLMEHKSKCPQGDQDASSKDFQITQCQCCKVWLEKEEHLRSHMLRCLENQKRLNNILSDRLRTKTDDGIPARDEISTLFYGIYCKTSTKEHLRKKRMRGTYSNISKKEKKFKCPKCSYQTDVKNNFNRHLDAHNEIKPFQCDVCERKFSEKGSLKRHLKNVHLDTIEKDYKCPHCSHQTNYKNNLNTHMNTHTDIKPFQCDFCKKKFNQKGHLTDHLKNRHSNTNSKEYKCSDCPYETNDKRSLKNHLYTHSDVKLFQCDICEKKFTRKGSMKVHIKNHSNTIDKEYKCFDCSYQTNYKNTLQSHLSTHTGIKKFRCDICKQTFNYKSNLEQHLKLKHSDTSGKEYKCSECYYQTNRKSNLKVHLITHRDVKPLQCDICQKRFNHKNSLTLHVRNEHFTTNEKEYKCPECSYQTNSKEHLKVHLNVHSAIKPFQCDSCEMKFSQKGHMKRHFKNKHLSSNEKAYKCTHCSYQANYKHVLKDHLNTHNGIKPFQCDICEKKFSVKGYLRSHIKNLHTS